MRRVEANSTLLYVIKKIISLSLKSIKFGGKMASIEEKIENLIKKPIENLGYILYDVQYVKEGKDYFLRIFIEKDEGSIDLNDCERVNNEINDLIDKADYIKEQYFLEVSSTGLEKILRKDEHLKQSINKEIQINLFKSIEITDEKKKKSKQKNLKGILKEFNNQEIKIQLDNKEIINVDRNNISQIKTVFDWDSLND